MFEELGSLGACEPAATSLKRLKSSLKQFLNKGFLGVVLKGLGGRHTL